ncbi:hypothetical protein [Massilia sp. ST3]|uniref:hypothetical protein n=1 Tax=Massilia sp. ST3 TaxID=2824903 RepID=UPI001B838F05|nr:hypothetical protein [Massilia sp. ST3]MBQ5949801.1 hypothetical protein [Massilia sp. ST3]
MTPKRLLCMALCLLLSMGGSAGAQTARDDAGCPRLERLKNMCLVVGTRMKDSATGTYMFETLLRDAACVGGAETEQQAGERIAANWKRFEASGYLQCTNANFDLDKGNIVKYAVSKKFEDFVDRLIAWNVDLNRVDASDGGTVLDYVATHIERNKGNALESTYRMYYMKLRQAGVLFQRELPQAR